MMGYNIRGKIIYVAGSIDGKHYRLSTKKEASPRNIKWIEKNHRDVLLQLVVELKQPKKRSLNLIEYGLYSLELNAATRKVNTTKGFLNLFQNHIQPYFRYFNLTDIKPSDIKNWQNQLLKKKLSIQSIKNCRTVLRGILSDAKIDEIIVSNPMDLVKAPKPQDEEEEVFPFTLDEVEKILSVAAADAWLQKYLMVAFFTGMRTGEILALKWTDIDFINKKIYVRRSITKGIISQAKTYKKRIIDLLPITLDAVKDLYSQNGLKGEWVFPHRNNEPYKEPGMLAKKFARVLASSGICYRKPYNTRHTFATMMLQQGEDLLWVSKTLGHANIATTMKHYIKYIPTKETKRAAFLDNVRTNIAHKENHGLRKQSEGGIG